MVVKTDQPCCQYFGGSLAAPGELGLKFPGADLQLSYFDIPACSAFEMHYHNHPEGLIMVNDGKLVNPLKKNFPKNLTISVNY